MADPCVAPRDGIDLIYEGIATASRFHSVNSNTSNVAKVAISPSISHVDSRNHQIFPEALS